MNLTQPKESQAAPWQKIVAKYQKPEAWRSIWQLVNTLVPYALLWYFMIQSLKISYWLTAVLAVIAAGFLIRLFIIFHDCGHGAFFKSRKAGFFWGYVTGVLTFTPYYYWWHSHAQHHACAGDLDNRGIGDVWTMTVEEYLKAPRRTQMIYRVARNPFCLFIIAPAVLFLILHRLPLEKKGGRANKSIHMTNLGILGMAIVMSLIMGWKTYLMLQIPVVMMSASMGVWLFYVQHQFEGVYWERKENWDYLTEALEGSSFYKLPKVLQWFTGNIGFHHIHHLSPRIPNYFLERCHNENPMFQRIKPITFFSSLKSLTFRLWDEQHQRLVGFDYLKELSKAKPA